MKNSEKPAWLCWSFVLISHLDARHQAALSVGADAFISKGETPEHCEPLLQAFQSNDATWLNEEDLKSGAPRLSRAPAQTGTAYSKDLEDQTMNKDIFEGKWKQIRGEAKSWWGKLTDDDLDRAAGKFDVFAGLLQEKYGYTRQNAADEIDKRVTAYENSMKEKAEPAPPR